MNKIISKNLISGKFIKIKQGEKAPVTNGKGDDWNDKKVTYDEANQFLLDGFNVGLVAGDGIIIIDADKSDVAYYCDEVLPKTYTEVTCSGGKHYVYVCNEKVDNAVIGNGRGEIRCNRQYVVIAPSIALNKDNPAKLKEYVVESDLPISSISKDKIVKLLSKFGVVTEGRDLEHLDQVVVDKEFILSNIIKNVSSYMKDLICTPKSKEELSLLGYPSRSERDMKIVTYLLNKGYGKYITSIFKLMGCGDKYLEHPSPEKYLQKTIESSIRFLGLRTQNDMDLEFEIEGLSPIQLKRHLDEYLVRINNIEDNTNLFKESLIATLAFRVKLGQGKLERRLKELDELSKPKEVISFLDLSRMEYVKQDYWLNPLIPKGIIIMLGSKPGEGKSLFIQGLCTSILTTGNFLGYGIDDRENLPKILIYSIDDSSKNILQGRQTFFINGLKNNPIYNFSNLENCQTSLTFDKTNLKKEVEFASKFDIIFVDSYRRVLTGTENDSDITDAFFNDFLKPLKQAGKTIFILHHLKKSNLEEVDDTELMDIFRGSSDIIAQLDLALALKTSYGYSTTPNLEIKDCYLKICKNRLGLPFRDLQGNTVHTLCYRVIRNLTDISTTFQYVDPSIMKSPKEKRQDLIKDVIMKSGTLSRQQIVKLVIPKCQCSEASIAKDLDEMVKEDILFKEKYGSYSINKRRDIVDK